MRWKTIRLVVTNVRIMDRRGFLMRRCREIPIGALTNIGYRQSLFKRLIGAGDILIESAGRDSQEVFPDLPRPALIHNEIYRQLEMWRNGRTPGSGRTVPASGSGIDPPSIPGQIEQLDVLRRRGIISEAEFAAKKTSCSTACEVPVNPAGSGEARVPDSGQARVPDSGQVRIVSLVRRSPRPSWPGRAAGRRHQVL